MIAESSTIGGYRTNFIVNSTIDPNYDSNITAIIILYVSTTSGPNRPLMGSSNNPNNISINSATDISNQAVKVQVLYVRQ